MRPSQKRLTGDIYSAISQRNILMAHASTGLGKTDSALSAAITHAIENDLTVFFLTPKISQHKIAIDVVRGLAEKYDLPLRAADLVGRSHCCIDDQMRELDDSESLMNLCARKRRDGNCEFFSNVRGNGRIAEARADMKFGKMLENYGAAKNHHDLFALGKAAKCCPYEWMLRIAEKSNVIIADYYHLMLPPIRDIFLAKTKKRLEDSIIIVDEAHNLASRVRSSLSGNLSTITLQRAAKEMRFMGLDSGPMDEDFAQWGREQMKDKKDPENKTIDAKEILVNPAAFAGFFSIFGLTAEEAEKRFEEAGDVFVEKTNRRSACLKVARFLESWRSSAEDDSCIRVLRRRGDMWLLSRKLLDPAPATRILNSAYSSVLMSGSLLPLEMHRDVLGLEKERVIMREYPSPFDPKRVVNIITPDLTTRYTKRTTENYDAMAARLDAIIAATPGGVAIFFPSFRVLGEVVPRLLSRNLHIQQENMRPPEVRDLLSRFRRQSGVLVGVQGGSLAEGVDYKDGEIKTVVVVGVALDEMGIETKSLIEYYDQKFGRGWDYGYLYPGTIKALQAAGRARRKESDRAAVVFMDERFQWKKYNWILNRSERMVMSATPEKTVAEFWKRS